MIGDKLISSSLDATIRQWSLKPADLQTAVDFEKEKQHQLVSGSDGTTPAKKMENEPLTDIKKHMLTEEEERELAEMMEDSD